MLTPCNAVSVIHNIYESPFLLALAIRSTALEVLLALGLDILGIQSVLQRHHRTGFSSAKHLTGALLRVLVVEGHVHVALCGVGSEEPRVQFLRLWAHGHHVQVCHGALAIGQRHGLRRGNKCVSPLLREVEPAVQFAIERLGILHAGGRMDEEQLAVDVVLQDVAGRPGLIRLAQALREVSSGRGVCAQQFLGRGDASATLLNGAGLDVNAVDGLQEVLRNSLGNQPHRTGVLSHLVNGQHAVADQVSLGEGEVGEHQTRAITQDDVLAEMYGLEVLGLSGCGRDGHLLGSNQGVDGR